MRPLREHQIVLATRGPGGGYQLTRPAREITVAHVLRSLDEFEAVKGADRAGVGYTQGFQDALYQRVMQFLESKTLEDLVQDAAPFLSKKPHADVTSHSSKASAVMPRQTSGVTLTRSAHIAISVFDLARLNQDATTDSAKKDSS